MSELSVQDRYAPESTCFACGSANARGLRLKSYVDEDRLVADWMPGPHHEAFPGVLNEGIIGALLDCHCGWTASHHFMSVAGAQVAPRTVTSEYAIKLLRPTPSTGPVHLSARVMESGGSRAVVEGTLEVGGKPCATCRGTFVAVKPGHPAYRPW